jgi:hypothetical protein
MHSRLILPDVITPRLLAEDMAGTEHCFATEG